MIIAADRRHLWRAVAAAWVLLCAHPVNCLAQAWLPPKGETSVTVGAQIFGVGWHLEFDGSKQERADVDIRNMTTDVTYGLSDRVAIDFGVPFVASRFKAIEPCPTPGLLDCAIPDNPFVDNGTYYSTFQDVRANVRWAMVRRTFVMTPSIQIVIPSHSYETFGHVAAGRDLNEVGFGLNVGRTLAPLLPNSYLHARYQYSLAQHLTHENEELNLDRSTVEVEAGHAVTRALTVRALSTWQFAHGGLEWVDELFMSEHGMLIHDQAAKASYWHLGGGASYSVNDSLTISAFVLGTMSGKNTHKVGGLALSTTWTFGGNTGLVGVPPSNSLRRVPAAVHLRTPSTRNRSSR